MLNFGLLGAVPLTCKHLVHVCYHKYTVGKTDYILRTLNLQYIGQFQKLDTLAKEDMGIPQILPLFFIGNFQQNNHFFFTVFGI